MSEKTIKHYNLDIFDPMTSVGSHDMPVINNATLPTNIEMIPFNYALSSKTTNVGIHFFIDDYQFERVWREPKRYMEMLKRFDFVLTPDFSLYTDMPLAMQLWNTYRGRLLGNYWQRNGLTVIPTLSWSNDDSFNFALDGLQQGGTYAISTVGCMNSKDKKARLINGIDYLIEILKPKRLLIYGSKLDHYDFKDIQVTYIKNSVVDRYNSLAKNRTL